jgi:fructokinase
LPGEQAAAAGHLTSVAVIVCAGEALVDLVPDPRPGGGPMNVAVTAARLGVPSAFVGRISTDGYGDLLWRHLEDAGVHLEAAERGPEPTARALVEHVPTPVFHFDGDGTADTCLERADLSPLGPGPHLLHGGTLGLFRGRTADVLAELVETTDAVVSLDPNARPQIIDDRAAWFKYFDRWCSRAALVKLSTEDLGWMWPGLTEADVARDLLDAGAAAVLVTHGGDGVVGHLTGRDLVVPAPRVTVVDTVGAGDAFCGGLLAALWQAGVTDRAALDALDDEGWTAELTSAVTIAALTCTRVGADPPWATEPGAR